MSGFQSAEEPVIPYFNPNLQFFSESAGFYVFIWHFLSTNFSLTTAHFTDKVNTDSNINWKEHTK